MEIHICRGCGKEFQARAKNMVCCSHECYNKHYYQKYRDYSKHMYQKNKDEIKARSKNYYLLHREEKINYAMEYYKENRNKVLEYHKQYRKAHKENLHIKSHKRYLAYKSNDNFKTYQYARHIKDRYGLTQDDIKEMYDKQNGICHVCLKSLGDDIIVDHDHDTDKVRGLLHNRCNTILADYTVMLKEKEEYLKNNLSHFGIKYSSMRAMNKRKDHTKFIEILKMQDYKCLICHRNFSWFDADSIGRRLWVVDHAHNRGEKVRGILCSRCNVSIGRLEIIKRYGQERIENYIRGSNLETSEIHCP